MKSIEASGKTVKDAIRNGLAELGCDSDDVDIQVVEMGSPGLFGMFGKPAKVRLTVKADDPALEIEMPVLSLDAGNTRKPKQDKRKAEKPAPKAEKPVEKAAPVEEAIAAIHSAHGVAVLAHPRFWSSDAKMLADGFARLKDVGLDGVEAVYQANLPLETPLHLRLAREAGLAVTAGSDFHGANKSSVTLGMNVEDEEEFLAPLFAALARRGHVRNPPARTTAFSRIPNTATKRMVRSRPRLFDNCALNRNKNVV